MVVTVIFIIFRYKLITKTMDTFKTIIDFEKRLTYKGIFCDYGYYIKDLETPIIEPLGTLYFSIDLCIDEIIEAFNDAVISDNYPGLYYFSYLIFLFKKALFTKQVSEEEARKIYEKYIGVVSLRKDGINYDQKNTSFVNLLIQYNKGNDEKDNLVHNTFLNFLKELKYSW